MIVRNQDSKHSPPSRKFRAQIPMHRKCPDTRACNPPENEGKRTSVTQSTNSCQTRISLHLSAFRRHNSEICVSLANDQNASKLLEPWCVRGIFPGIQYWQ